MIPEVLDHFILWWVAPLAVIFLLSGLDDLAVDVAWLCAWLADRAARRLPDVAPRPIAILVPLWHEDAVIARMLEHNLAAIRYASYHIFAGTYANDALTEEAVASISKRFSNVHLAVCPHDGPTSKADCLNWIYQHVGLYEEQNGVAFDIIITHDAEDLIHPEELRWINAYAKRFDFIQIPVLALATPFWSLTHGVYAMSLPRTICAIWWCAPLSAALFRAREWVRGIVARRWRNWLGCLRTACSNQRR